MRTPEFTPNNSNENGKDKSVEFKSFLQTLTDINDLDMLVEKLNDNFKIKEELKDFRDYLWSIRSKNKKLCDKVDSAISYIALKESYKTLGAEYAEKAKYIFTPEYVEKSRKRMKIIRNTYIAVLGSLALSIGVMKYQHDKDWAQKEKTAKEWQKNKLPLPFTEIEAQVDTIFQSLQDSPFLYEEYDTLQKVADNAFELNSDSLRNEYREKILNYFDTLKQNSPTQYQSLLTEFWKNKNGMENNYYNIAYYPNNIDKPVQDIKNEYGVEKKSLEKDKQNFLIRLKQAYYKAGGNTITWDEAVKMSKPENVTQKQNSVEENKYFTKFYNHVNSLTKADYEEYMKVLLSDSAVQEIRIELISLTEKLNNEENSVKEKITNEKNQKIQDLKTKEQSSLSSIFEKYNKNPEMVEYFKEFYLVNEIFDKYDALQDTTLENNLKELESKPVIAEMLEEFSTDNKIFEAKFKNDLFIITLEYQNKEQETKKDFDSQREQILGPIKERLRVATDEYNKKVTTARDVYKKKFKKVWEEELKNKRFDQSKIGDINPDNLH